MSAADEVCVYDPPVHNWTGRPAASYIGIFAFDMRKRQSHITKKGIELRIHKTASYIWNFYSHIRCTESVHTYTHWDIYTYEHTGTPTYSTSSTPCSARADRDFKIKYLQCMLPYTHNYIQKECIIFILLAMPSGIIIISRQIILILSIDAQRDYLLRYNVSSSNVCVIRVVLCAKRNDGGARYIWKKKS